MWITTYEIYEVTNPAANLTWLTFVNSGFKSNDFALKWIKKYGNREKKYTVIGVTAHYN